MLVINLYHPSFSDFEDAKMGYKTIKVITENIYFRILRFLFISEQTNNKDLYFKNAFFYLVNVYGLNINGKNCPSIFLPLLIIGTPVSTASSVFDCVPSANTFNTKALLDLFDLFS